VQVGGVEILWAVIGGSVIMLTLAVGYVVVYVHSHRRIVQAQEAKLEEVRKSEEKFKSLFDNSLAGIMRFSLESWTISEANEALQLLSGCISKNDIQHWAAKLPPAAIQRIRESLNNAGSISGYEIQTTGMNGDPLWILFAARKLNEEPFAQAVVVDITKRKQYEEQITEQSALLDQTQDAIVVIDYGGTIQFWNAGAELMYGWSRDEADGRLIGDLLFTEPQREKYHAAMEDIRQFKEWNGEHHQVRNDRKEILVESRWRAIEKATTGKMQILIVNSDITEKKRLEAHYVRAQKMESIALLTGGMAHDLQNILAPVAMSVPLLQTKVTDKAGLEILKAVEESAHSGLELVKNILTYGRGIVGERVAVDIARVVDQVSSVVTPGLLPGIRIERKLNGRLPSVEGDPHQLKQVFLNLCINARDAMPSGGVLSISMTSVESDERLLDEHPYAEPGPYVVVTISDTGTGIRDEDLERIFEPFFTTKEHGNGTGLGLSIAQGIVKSHQGYITVRSGVRSGTAFSVYLPALVE
jgi:two-component system, cell cycle sensor histidine kinase and response regulator CckA